MRKSILLALAALAAAPAAHAEVMVHLFQWRFDEIATECENFLGPKGYKAVQITPPNEHLPASQWWAVYQPISYTNFTSMGGNEAQLKDMINRCKAVGVDIYADAVINHMAGGSGQGTGGGGYDSGGRNYPDFNSGDFHEPRCTIQDGDYTGSRHNVQHCGLLGMPDLNTSSQKVQEVLSNYLKTLLSFGVAGFRVDAAKHIAAHELKAIVEKAGNPLIYSEVIGKDNEPIKVDEYDDFGMVTEFSYATRIADYFNGSISGIRSIGDGLLASDKAQVFVVNHDRERGHGGSGTLTYKDGRDSGKYNLANVFMLAYPYGWPQVMSGYDFGSDDNMGRPNSPATECGGTWNCDHRYSNIANMVAFHNSVEGTAVANWTTDGNNRIAFSRGNKGFVAINNEGSTWSQSFQTGLPAGEYCDVLSGTTTDICSGTKVVVDGSGNANITIKGNGAAAIYIEGGAEPDGKPVVKITGAPTAWVKVGTSVTLTADAHDTDNTDEIKSYKWSSGETTASITKVMATEGKQSFTVTVTDDEGETATATVNINVGDEPAVCNLPALFIRGTFNGWAADPLECVGANRWEGVFEFDGKADAKGSPQRFKFTEEADNWNKDWGDADNDGVLDTGSSTNDIITDVVGKYVVTVHDATASAMTYTITPYEDKPTDAKPVAKITHTGSLSVDIADGRKLVKLSGLTSSDAEGAVTYAWSRGAAASCLEGEGTFVASSVGSFPITLTVTDSAGQTATDTVTVTVINSDTPDAPVASIQASSSSVDIKNGPQTVTFTAKVTGSDKGLSYAWSTGENGASISKTYSAKGNDSVWVDVSNSDNVTTRATISVTIKDSSSGPVSTGEYGLYRTNPNGGKGKSATITIDGNPSDWTQDMLIAQGVANDEPRAFRGNHEGPVYDLYALYAAWDDANLYLMWQYANVTDVVDPAQGYPISDNGKPWNGNMPIQLAFDIDPNREGDGTADAVNKLTGTPIMGTDGSPKRVSVWGNNIYNTFANGIDHLLMFSSKPKVGEPAVFTLNDSNSFVDNGKDNTISFTAAGIEYMWGDHQFVESVMAVNKPGAWAGYTYEMLGDVSNFVDMTTLGHDAKQDTIYEMKIPLATFGITRAQLESQGIGVMLISTFGNSAIDSLPHDSVTLDNANEPYEHDESSSAEKNDQDNFTAAPARIGA